MTITIIGIGHQILDILSTNNTFHKQILHSQNIMSTQYTFGVQCVHVHGINDNLLVAIRNFVTVGFENGIDK